MDSVDIGMAQSEAERVRGRIASDEIRGFFFAEGAQFAGASFDGGGGHLIGQRGGASAGARRSKKKRGDR